MLSFGAIGAIVVHHFGVSEAGWRPLDPVRLRGRRGGVRALVGALVALPPLRLRGLYLALSTMAFVFVSNMLLRARSPSALPLLHTRFSIFPSGNLGVPCAKFGPVDLAAMPTFLMFVTVLFAVLGVGLVVLRHSSYGAAPDRDEGQPRGLGHARAEHGVACCRCSCSRRPSRAWAALMTAQIGSANIDRFDIFLSLSLLMLTVVGGIGYVSGALFGGLAAACCS